LEWRRTVEKNSSQHKGRWEIKLCFCKPPKFGGGLLLHLNK
jgi:hypothetical protein